MELAFLFFWIVFAIIVGVAANTRGRDGVGWFVLAVLISPLLAGLLLLALPLHFASGTIHVRSRGEDATSLAVAPIPQALVKKCPYCAQMIPLEALVCHLCRRDVDTPESVKVLLDNENKRIEDEKNREIEIANENARKARRRFIAELIVVVLIIIGIAVFGGSK